MLINVKNNTRLYAVKLDINYNINIHFLCNIIICDVISNS